MGTKPFVASAGPRWRGGMVVVEHPVVAAACGWSWEGGNRICSKLSGVSEKEPDGKAAQNVAALAASALAVVVVLEHE